VALPLLLLVILIELSNKDTKDNYVEDDDNISGDASKCLHWHPQCT